MNDECETLDSSTIEEDCPVSARLTTPQKKAMKSIYELNSAYPKRWFTPCELKIRVYDSTLESLARHGYLEVKTSEVNEDVRYFRATGKGFEAYSVNR